MYNFLDFINLKEEVTPAFLDPKGRNDIAHQGTRDSINVALSNIQSDCLTPYIGLERVRKALAYFHIHIPGVQFLEGEHGIKVFEVSQYGSKTGMKNDGEVATANDSEYFIVFEWLYSYSGFYNIRCSLVDADKLQKRLDNFEKYHVTLDEEEKKDDKEFIRKQYARAYADSNHKMTDDAKKMVQKKIKSLSEKWTEEHKAAYEHGYNSWKDYATGKQKNYPKNPHKTDGSGKYHAWELGAESAYNHHNKHDLSEARLKKNELAAMQDAIRMQASLQGRKVKIPKPKPRRPKDEQKFMDDLKMGHWKMKQQVRKTSLLPPPKKDNGPTALIPKIDPVTGTNVVPKPRPPRPYKMPGTNPDLIGREGGSPGPAAQTMHGHKDSIDPKNARLRTGIPRPAVESDFEIYIKKYNETGKKEWIDKARRWAAADYAYHKPEYPDAAEMEYKLRQQAIKALEDSHGPSKLSKIGGLLGGVFKRKTVKEEVSKTKNIEEGILRFIDKKIGSPLQKGRIDKMNVSGKKNRTSAEIVKRSENNKLNVQGNKHLTGGWHARNIRNKIKGIQQRDKQLANRKIALKDLPLYNIDE